MHIAQFNFVFDEDLASADALCDRYSTLTGWSEALLAAGAGRVSIVQRFHSAASFSRRGVEYTFYVDGRGGRPRAWSSSRSLARIIRELDVDVAHVNGLNQSIDTWKLRRMLPPHAALVVQDHASAAPSEATNVVGALKRAVLRRFMRAPDAYLVSTDAQAAPWRAAGLIAENQATHAVLEASTSMRPLPRAEARSRSGVEGSPALLWVGRLNANKDPLTVVEGVEQVLQTCPAARLTMAYQTTDLLPAVEARLAKSNRLGQAVRLVGRVPHEDLSAFYSAADVFVLGSHHEGSGFAVLEACACGAVPVVTDIPSFRRMTADGKMGRLWTAGRPQDLSRALVEVVRTDLPALSARVTEHFERNLSWQAVGTNAVTAYRTVLGARGLRR
jgi:glycosyltransferase involved in cell wall biosynthesis